MYFMGIIYLTLNNTLYIENYTYSFCNSGANPSNAFLSWHEWRYTIEVCEWISSIAPHFIMDVIISHVGTKLNHVYKRGPGRCDSNLQVATGEHLLRIKLIGTFFAISPSCEGQRSP